MMKQLQHLRDFLDAEQMKWLPSNIKVENCILLTQNKTKPDKEGTFHTTVLQVFDSGGTWIGEISDPDYIPKK